MVYTDGSRYWVLCFMIDDVIQSCLAYGIQISSSNRLYEWIVELKCIFMMSYVILYNEIYFKKLFVLRGWLVCELEILMSLLIWGIHTMSLSNFN